jgi:hypothetical protein
MNGHDWAHLYRGLVSCFVFQKSSTRSARVTGKPSITGKVRFADQPPTGGLSAEKDKLECTFAKGSMTFSMSCSGVDVLVNKHAWA